LNDTALPARRGFGPVATFALGAFALAILAFFYVSTADISVPGSRAAATVAAGYYFVLFILMIMTGNVAKWRRVFFVSVAVLFVPTFIAILLEDRGSMAISQLEVFKNETPFCHIVLPVTILPYLLQGVLIFPARINDYFASVYGMLAIWLVGTLTLGRGWCSWVCFYGGWDDGLSRVAKKAALPLADKEGRVRYLGFAMLAFVVLASLGSLTAVYCTWLCPWKAVTEYSQVTDAASYLAFVLFVCIFAAFVIVLPILTRKRVQCMSFCPFGAFQSLVDKASPYRVRIDRAACVGCGACERACPTLSLSAASIAAGKTLMTCTKCGECAKVCEKGAIGYSFAWSKACGNPRGLAQTLRERVKGEGIAARIARALLTGLDEVASPKALLVTTGFTIGAIVSGSFASGTILRLWHLVSTGSFLLK
jgi:polyferredoxin